jgi:hypothetical protein
MLLVSWPFRKSIIFRKYINAIFLFLMADGNTLFPSELFISIYGVFCMSENEEVIPGVTKADIDLMANQVFGRTDRNHPELESSPDDIVQILEKGGPMVAKSNAFLRKINS